VKGKSDVEVIQALRGRGFFPIEVFPARQRIIATFFMIGMVALTKGILLLLGEVLTELRSWILLIGRFIFLTKAAYPLALKLQSAMETGHLLVSPIFHLTILTPTSLGSSIKRTSPLCSAS